MLLLYCVPLLFLRFNRGLDHVVVILSTITV
jgi:hypothetical protein